MKVLRRPSCGDRREISGSARGTHHGFDFFVLSYFGGWACPSKIFVSLFRGLCVGKTSFPPFCLELGNINGASKQFW